VAVENVAGKGFAAGRPPHEQRQLPVGHRLLRQVVVDDQRVLPLIHEVFGDGSPRVGSDVLQGRRFARGGAHHHRVIHRAVGPQGLDHAGHRRRPLTAGHVDADDVLPFLVDDRIDADRGLPRLAVADDQLALPAANRRHGVDRLDPGLQRLLDGLPPGNARSHHFERTRLRREDRAFPVQRVAQRIDNPPHDGLAHGHRQKLSCAFDFISLGDLEIIAKNDNTHRVLFEVEDLPAHAAGEFDHFAGHRPSQAIDARDAVADFEHPADFAGLDLPAKVFNLFLND